MKMDAIIFVCIIVVFIAFSLYERYLLYSSGKLIADIKEKEREEYIVSDAPSLILAAQKGDKEDLENILRAGADVNIQDSKKNTALIVASWSGHKDIVEILLSNNANINIKDGEALYAAVERGHKDIAELLLKNGINLKKDEMYAIGLLYGAASNDIEILNLLLKYGADPKYQDGLNPLIPAVGSCNKEAVRILLDAGADPNGIDVINDEVVTGNTPLIELSGHSFLREKGDIVEIAKMLLNAGADPNIKNEEGKTALMSAKSWNNKKLIKILVEFGARQ